MVCVTLGAGSYVAPPISHAAAKLELRQRFMSLQVNIYSYAMFKLDNTTSIGIPLYLQAQLNIVLVHPQSSTS